MRGAAVAQRDENVKNSTTPTRTARATSVTTTVATVRLLVLAGARLSCMTCGLPTVTDNDFEVQVGVVAFDPITPGAFYRVHLDTCGTPTRDWSRRSSSPAARRG